MADHGRAIYHREVTPRKGGMMATGTQWEHERAALDVIAARRAVRSYASDTLDRTTIHTLLDAAVRAPTAMHLEPWAFVIVQDRALLRRYSERAKMLLREEAPAGGGAHAPGMLADPAFNIFYDAGTLIVICGRPVGSFVVADCWLAAENLMLAATGLGLGTCCIGFAVPLLNNPDVKQELGIPQEVTAVAPIIVGIPRGETPATTRKPPEILSWRG